MEQPTFSQTGFGTASPSPSPLSSQQEEVWQHHHHDFSNGDDSVVSDCESGVSGTRLVQQQHSPSPGLFLVRLGEGDVVHDLLKRRFLRGLGFLGAQAQVLSIHRNACSGVVSQARLQSFHVYARAVANLRGGGNANVKYAWYGTRGEKEIRDILSHGFGHAHGNTLCLSPDDSPLERFASLALRY